MIFAENLIKVFHKKKINFFTGVPDSTLKKFTVLLDKVNKVKHIISTNEGSAVGLAIGYYLSTKRLAAVYLQNSGLGNAINPLISIAHSRVYSIPMLLIIGWRGSPNNKNDEPQHMAQGNITMRMLKLLNIKTCVLKNDKNFKQLSNLIAFSKKHNRPVACLIKRNILTSEKNIKIIKKNTAGLERAYVIEKILQNIKKKTRIVSTTGYASRELYQIRKSKNLLKGKDFYMVGGMGHSSMVALGVALNTKEETLCIDGDGAVLMHLGSLNISAHFGKKNFKHILLNNSAHESVGGQKTLANKIDFRKLTLSLGYKNFFKINNKLSLEKKLKKFLNSKGPSFLEIKIKLGSLKNLVRPKNLINIKKNFYKFGK